MSNILLKSFQLTALATALTLVGCGGGGNDTLPQPPNNTNTNQRSNSTVTDQQNNNAVLNVTDITLSSEQANFIPSSGTTAKVKVTDANGAGVSGAIVAFSATGSVSFSTTNGSVLTDSEGNASIFVKPTDINDSGAYTLTASVSHNGNTATSKEYPFSLQAVNLNITEVVPVKSSLEIGESTNVSVIVKNAKNEPQADTTVNFSTSCGSFTNASVMTNGEGVATTTYRSIKADGSLCDTTSATITAATTTGSSKTTNISIAPITGNAIAYTTSSEVKLGANNSGSSQSKEIEFTVYSNGKPVANQDVQIEKTYAPLDFRFVKSDNSEATTVKSDSEGKVRVELYPGATPGPVEIKASLKNGNNVVATALSKNVSVATGRPVQEGFDISLSKNTLAYNVSGDTATVTASLRDKFGNAVPDGTVVSFVAEGGKIGSNCSTSDGNCSVTFTTQEPRSDGRISVVAYVEGDKSYTDTNGNNRFDAGEPITSNIGGFFRDDNENGQYDTGEFTYKRSTGNLSCMASNFTYPNLANTCTNDLEGVLRYQFVLGLAKNVPTFVGMNSSLPGGAGTRSTTFKMYGNSERTVSMPAGTTVSVTAKDNTNATPAVSIENGELIVVNAKPNSTVSVKIGNATETVFIDATGIGRKPYTGTSTETPTVSATTNLSCSAEIVAGHLTVPALVDLSNKTVADEDVSYTISYKDCEAGDEIRITTTAPAPANKVVTQRFIIQ